MKKIKEIIQEHFVVAMKAKDESAKSALSGIKAKITEVEKANGNKELTDSEVIKVLTKAIKQRKESQEIYEKAGRKELARKEEDEASVLERYMPAQMTSQEIVDSLIGIMQEFSESAPNPNVLQGKTIGEFNKRHNGKADIGTVRMLLTNLIEAQ
jgi:uncharacterized protein YqeY